MEIIKLDDDDVKRRKTGDQEAACLINILPHKVLCVILSFLTLEEAGRTSLVSRRWRYLWRFTSGPNLVFELRQKNIETLLSEIERKRGNEIKHDKRVTEFLNSVNQIMTLHQGICVGKLIIGFLSFGCYMPLESQDKSICDWLQFAMQKQVTVLEFASFGYNMLFLGRPGLQQTCNIVYDFPDPDKFLSISSGILEPKRIRFLVSLKSLKLVDIKIQGEMIEYLLSNCPCLEQLYIKGAPRIIRLHVHSQSLKSLSLCDFSKLKNMKISAENLVSFEYMGQSETIREVEFCFENVPSLSKVKMNEKYMRSFVYQKHLHEMYYDQLEELVWDLPSQVNVGHLHSPISTVYRNLPRLRSLKRLELVIRVNRDESLIFYVLWAMACPSLSTFSIQFSEERRMRTLPHRNKRRTKLVQKQLNSYRHEHLKLVELINFAGHLSYIEFALDLLQVAKSLEKLIVNSENDLQRVAIIENHVKQLQANLPVGAELVIN